MSNVAYRALTTVEQIFKDLVWDPGVKAGELALEGSFPFLALPVVKSLDEAVIKAVTDYAFHQIVLLVDVQAIRLVNSAHQSAFDHAAVKLKILAHDKGITSPEFLDAKAAAQIALSQFVRFGA